MSWRHSLRALGRRQPFASRRSLEVTAAQLRHELEQLRLDQQAARAQLEAEVAALRRDAERAVAEVARLADRLDGETRQAWNEVAESTRAWGARLLDLEHRLHPPPRATDPESG